MDTDELIDLLQDRVLERYVAVDIVRMYEDMTFWGAVHDITEDTKRNLKRGKENMREDLYLAYDEFNEPIYRIITPLGETVLTIGDMTDKILDSFQDRIICLPNVERYIMGMDLHNMRIEIARKVFYDNLSIITDVEIGDTSVMVIFD